MPVSLPGLAGTNSVVFNEKKKVPHIKFQVTKNLLVLEKRRTLQGYQITQSRGRFFRRKKEQYFIFEYQTIVLNKDIGFV